MYIKQTLTKQIAMNKLISTCLFVIFFASGTYAQNQSFGRIFDRYADKDGFVTVRVSNPSSLLFGTGCTNSDLTISSVKVLTVQDSNLNSTVNFYNEIVPQINRTGYEELITIKKKGEKAILLCKRDRTHIKEMLFVSGGKNNVMFEITGSMTLAQARTITNQVTKDDYIADDK